MTNNFSNTSSNNPESETKLPVFSTLTPFNMEHRKKVSNKNDLSTNVSPKVVLSKQRFNHNRWQKCGGFCIAVCIAGAIPKLQKKIINGNFCMCACV